MNGELLQFIKDNKIKITKTYDYVKESEVVFVILPFELLKDFTDTVGAFYFDDERAPSIRLRSDYVVIDLNDIIERHFGEKLQTYLELCI